MLTEYFHKIFLHPTYHVVVLWIALLGSIVGCMAIDHVVITPSCLNITMARMVLKIGCNHAENLVS